MIDLNDPASPTPSSNPTEAFPFPPCGASFPLAPEELSLATHAAGVCSDGAGVKGAHCMPVPLCEKKSAPETSVGSNPIEPVMKLKAEKAAPSCVKKEFFDVKPSVQFGRHLPASIKTEYRTTVDNKSVSLNSISSSSKNKDNDVNASLNSCHDTRMHERDMNSTATDNGENLENANDVDAADSEDETVILEVQKTGETKLHTNKKMWSPSSGRNPSPPRTSHASSVILTQDCTNAANSARIPSCLINHSSRTRISDPPISPDSSVVIAHSSHDERTDIKSDGLSLIHNVYTLDSE